MGLRVVCELHATPQPPSYFHHPTTPSSDRPVQLRTPALHSPPLTFSRLRFLVMRLLCSATFAVVIWNTLGVRGEGRAEGERERYAKVADGGRGPRIVTGWGAGTARHARHRGRVAAVARRNPAPTFTYHPARLAPPRTWPTIPPHTRTPNAPPSSGLDTHVHARGRLRVATARGAAQPPHYRPHGGDSKAAAPSRRPARTRFGRLTSVWPPSSAEL